MSKSPRTEPVASCRCSGSSEDSSLSEPDCYCDWCPTDQHGVTIHRKDCSLFKNETFVYPGDICECGLRKIIQKTGRDICVCGVAQGAEKGLPCKCDLPEHVPGRDVCTCGPTEDPELGLPCECDLPEHVQVSRHVCKCHPPEGAREALDELRKKQKLGAMPAVLEASHPLMQRFQQSLREFLLKENSMAANEIIGLKDDLRETKVAYEKELENIYKSDHDCNDQRVLIEEYEATLSERTAARKDAEQRVKDANVRHKRAREQLDQDLAEEREATEELEALTNLCQQLEKWREETMSEMTVSQLMSNKTRLEKRVLAEEKREMDMMVFWLTNEVWKLESKLEMLRKQTEIKTVEMDKINDKVTAYGAEVEDLDLDKRRLISLWHGVLNNISQRDRIYNFVTEDYSQLKKNFHTLIINLEIIKKELTAEMTIGTELTMKQEKINYDIEKVAHLFNVEDAKRITLETATVQVLESIDMTDKDINLIKMENFTMRNILQSSCKEFDHKVNKKLKLENEILANLQECLLNNKAVETMAKGIKNMREMSRKQELALSTTESQHSKLELDIEFLYTSRDKNKKILTQTLAEVREKEDEFNELQEKVKFNDNMITQKSRELDIVIGKHTTLKELFDGKSPQELRVEDLEAQIMEMRERLYGMQHEWLRVQGHVVKLTEQYHDVVKDIQLSRKQLQICEQKTMHIFAASEKVRHDISEVDKNLRDLRGRLQVLERTRKEAADRNNNAQKFNVSITHEYAVNLKGAEMRILELEDEIEVMDKEKVILTQDLDRVQREALIWQRKGILAVELRKNMKEAKSAVGEIGKMKHEIHRMETHREHLRRTSEKLSEDLAHCVKLREAALEKNRATEAVEKAHGAKGGRVLQTAYHHKLKLVKADVTRAMKQLNKAEATLKKLLEDQKSLERNIDKTKSENEKLEEQIASLIQKCRETKCQKQWLLERVVRSQRYGSELAIAVRRQSLEVKKEPVLMKKYTEACALNDRIKYIVHCLTQEYPHLNDKLTIISNTLDIHSPSGSPRLSEAPTLCNLVEEGENVADNQQSSTTSSRSA